jgi:hypothetical protein
MSPEATKAIDYYLKAVEVDPVAYPTAYFKLAQLVADAVIQRGDRLHAAVPPTGA